MDNNFLQNNINNNFGPINGTIQNQTIHQPAPVQPEKAREPNEAESPFYFNTDKFNKVDLIRLLYAMQQLKMVVDENGEPVTQKDFITQMGKLFHVDMKGFWNNLSEAKSSCVRDATQTKIFDDLKRAFQKNYLDKQ